LGAELPDALAEENVMKLRFFLLLIILGIVTVTPARAQTNNSSPAKVTGKPITTASGLQYWDIMVGTGATAVVGKDVKVHFTMWLTTGKQLESTVGGKSVMFMVGAGRLSKGLDEGVVGMKVGGKRQLRVPPALGFGPIGAPPMIPPNATLIYEVELLDVGVFE
jgi:FKBP-type peptidyl-prolyl cis-trans isomerase